MSRLNAIIVNYCTPGLVLKCIDSILQKGVVDAAGIIVVDNSPTDESWNTLKERLPAAVVKVRADRNEGFGAGINLAARYAHREFLLVLNPDTYFLENEFGRVFDCFDARPDVGIVGLDLVYPGGERQYSARRFYSALDILCRRSPLGRIWPFSRLMRRHLMMDAWSASGPFEAEWVMGTGFVIRSSVFAKLGGMDQRYFLYMEDVDLCARAWQSGSRVVCIPGVRLVHDHQRASAAGPFSRSGRMHLASMRLFASRFRMPLLVPPGIARLFR